MTLSDKNHSGCSSPEYVQGPGDTNRALTSEPQLGNGFVSSGQRSRTRKILVFVFIVLLIVGAYAGFWELSSKFRTVEKGILYRSAELSDKKLIELCRKHGIRTVIDLRTDETKALAEESSLKMIGVKHIHLPSTQIPSSQKVKLFLRIMDESSNRPVLMHCVHGIGRTGLFSAIYRMEYQGWTNSRALLEAMVLSGFGSFLPNSQKAKLITNYTPRR